jgi:transcriptional regulator with XRE-family HTH domain
VNGQQQPDAPARASDDASRAVVDDPATGHDPTIARTHARSGRPGGELAGARRPITSAELPALALMGARVRELREAAGFGQGGLAEAAGLSRRGLSMLERGVRRTRRSTIDRLAGVLAEPLGRLAGEISEELAALALAGDALAPESDYPERVARRAERRQARRRRHREATAAEQARVQAEVDRLNRRLDRREAQQAEVARCELCHAAGPDVRALKAPDGRRHAACGACVAVLAEIHAAGVQPQDVAYVFAERRGLPLPKLPSPTLEEHS